MYVDFWQFFVLNLVFVMLNCSIMGWIFLCIDCLMAYIMWHFTCFVIICAGECLWSDWRWVVLDYYVLPE